MNCYKLRGSYAPTLGVPQKPAQPPIPELLPLGPLRAELWERGAPCPGGIHRLLGLPGHRGQAWGRAGEAAVTSVCCAVCLQPHSGIPGVTISHTIRQRQGQGGVQPEYSRDSITRYFPYSAGISVINSCPHCVHVKLQISVSLGKLRDSFVGLLSSHSSSLPIRSHSFISPALLAPCYQLCHRWSRYTKTKAPRRGPGTFLLEGLVLIPDPVGA